MGRQARLFWWLASSAWLVALMGAGVQAWSDALEPKQRLLPSLEFISIYGVLLCLASFVVVVVWLAMAKPLRGARNRWLIVLGMVFAFVIPTGIAGSSTVMMTMFKGQYIAQLDVPEDRKTYYVYTEGVFCGYDVYARSYGALFLDKLRNQARKCDGSLHDVELDHQQGKVVIVGPDGKPLTPHSRDFSGLYFGPR